MKYNFMTIEGNIGAGKTTLATKLSEQFNGKLILESFSDNPFLPKFYSNPNKYSFALELFFMAERYHQIQERVSEQDLFKSFTVSDYLFIKSLIFAKVNLVEEEFRLYTRLFNIINTRLPQPDLLLYLHSPVDKLQENIKIRGRGYEQGIENDYLQSIQETYFSYFKKQDHLRILVLDMQELDFINDPSHYDKIIEILEEDYSFGMHYITLD